MSPSSSANPVELLGLYFYEEPSCYYQTAIFSNLIVSVSFGKYSGEILLLG
jgi:hypothetical protein